MLPLRGRHPTLDTNSSHVFEVKLIITSSPLNYDDYRYPLHIFLSILSGVVTESKVLIALELIYTEFALRFTKVSPCLNFKHINKSA